MPAPVPAVSPLRNACVYVYANYDNVINCGTSLLKDERFTNSNDTSMIGYNNIANFMLSSSVIGNHNNIKVLNSATVMGRINNVNELSASNLIGDDNIARELWHSSIIGSQNRARYIHGSSIMGQLIEANNAYSSTVIGNANVALATKKAIIIGADSVAGDLETSEGITKAYNDAYNKRIEEHLKSAPNDPNAEGSSAARFLASVRGMSI